MAAKLMPLSEMPFSEQLRIVYQIVSAEGRISLDELQEKTDLPKKDLEKIINVQGLFKRYELPRQGLHATAMEYFVGPIRVNENEMEKLISEYTNKLK